MAKQAHLHDFPGHRTNVSSAMALDFCNIRQPSNRESIKLSIQSASNRLSNTRLSYAGRARQKQNLAMCCAAQLANSNEFKDPLFDLYSFSREVQHHYETVTKLWRRL